MELARVYDVVKDSGAQGSAQGSDQNSGRGGEAEAWFLVDRLWPRGVSKENLPLTGWPKELTPSSELRKDFHSGELSFTDFSNRYRTELDDALDDGELEDALRELEEAGAKPPRSDAKTEQTAKDGVLLLYGAKDTEQNHAIVLLEWLNTTLRERRDQ
ncbi:DUF488 domain-containing protein [Corynebacterium urealyticum]|uniref:DUF488 family protein n=1 Tax=Corynebacterium urealyticum TaxID=43771 RepID=A0A5D4FUP7_9CORY|nr:DUF488 family protein [Corynebacterium urealyticum]TYR19758.1 DUF488 family protein [Corynebacterium urealyticum]